MNGDDVRGIGRLAGRALAGGTRRVEEMHTSIAGRVFRRIGPPAEPVRAVHDAVATGTYAVVRGALRAGATVTGRLVGDSGLVAGPPVEEAPVGRHVLAALNGGFGDLLEREVTELATVMSLRDDEGRVLPVRRDALAAAYPAATGRLVVFVHGLVETERHWWFRAERHHGDARISYGSLLDEDLGYSPVWLRYNTGLRISRNGQGLDRLMEQVVAQWPVPVTDLAFVGHSMGGLVVRSALHQAAERAEGGWPDLVRATVTLGSPHLGAPLERAANVATHALNLLGETRPFGAILAARSAGIKDLRYGNVVEADWHGHDPDALLHNTRTAVPLHSGGRHFAVVATLTGPHDSLAGRLLGDLMVQPLSAAGDTGDDDRLAFPDEHVVRLRGLHHLDLLNHPRVYRRLRTWLAELT